MAFEDETTSSVALNKAKVTKTSQKRLEMLVDSKTSKAICLNSWNPVVRAVITSEDRKWRKRSRQCLRMDSYAWDTMGFMRIWLQTEVFDGRPKIILMQTRRLIDCGAGFTMTEGLES